jgi:hypothetical protein
MRTLFSSSQIVLILLVVLITWRMLYWGIPFVMDWDAFGQYSYLPMLFDLQQFKFTDISHFEWIQHEYLQTETLYQFTQLENGNWITRYTMGLSILWLPFYAVGELWANVGNYPTDGFSYPYKVCIAFGTWFYLIAALEAFRRLLRHFFTENLSAIVLLLVVLGTNVFFTFFATPAISHNFIFLFLSLLVIQTIRFHKQPTALNGLLLGIILGFITAIRVPNILFVLIPILWGSTNLNELWNQLKRMVTFERKPILMALAGFFLVFGWQLLYWRYNSGQWLMNSYANTHGEGLDLFSPYFFEFLFSYRKGWFIYTPIMIFAIWGLFKFWKSEHAGGLAFSVSFVLFFWVVSSWTTWWYADSYSQRAMIDFYPLLGIGLGYFIEQLKQKRQRVILYSAMGLLTAFNLFQTYQISHGILHTSRMTGSYYWSTFGQIAPPTDSQRNLLLDDPYSLQLSHHIDTNRFTKCVEQSFELNDFFVNHEQPYAPAFDIDPKTLSSSLHFWVEITWYFDSAQTLDGIIFSACALHKKQAYQWMGYSISDDFVNWNPESGEFTYRYVTPNIRHKNDNLRFGFWSTNGNYLKANGVTIRAFARKDLK